MDRQDFRCELNNEDLIKGSYNSRILKYKKSLMTVVLLRLLICTPRERGPPGLIGHSVIKQAITLTLYNTNAVLFLK